MERKIIAPINLEIDNNITLDWVKKYSKCSKSEIILINVVEKSSFLERIFGKSGLNDTVKTILETEIQEKANKILAPEYNFSKVVREGKPYEEIEKVVIQNNPIAVVVGKNEKQDKEYIGSNTLHLISDVSNPVISIFGDQTPDKAQNNILVPFDISKSYNEQLSAAFELSKIFEARLHFFSIDYHSDIAHKAKLLVKMKKIKEFFEKNNVEANTEILEASKSDITRIINEKADKLNPLFTMIMLRDERNQKSHYIGTVAQEILRTCHSPVMSIKPWIEEVVEDSVFDAFINPLDIF